MFTCVRTNIKQVEILLEQGGGAKVVILVPVPSYVRNPCCGDGGHVTNRAENDFFDEILSAEKRLIDAAAAGCRTGEAKFIDLCKLFGSVETPHSGPCNVGRYFNMGRRRCASHIAGLQDGGETPDG
jgi:hypothetical protein